MICTIGKATKPTLAATANDRRIRNVAAIRAMVIAKGTVAKTAAPPAKVRMLRPPRKCAKTGNAWPTIAAAHPT
jgi:hypothetical protein